MSNLGFQTVYKLFAEQPRFQVDRAYLPDEEFMTDGGKPDIRTFERDRPLSSSEILAVSVSFETDYPYVLQMLQAAGLDLNAQRNSSLRGFEKDAPNYRPFILGGGAALTLNPEPLANFFDAIVVGEGEDVVGEICAAYSAIRDAGGSYEELLEQLSQLEGVYIPSFYRPEYADDYTVSSVAIKPGAPQKILRRYLEDINRYATQTVIQTPETEFKSMFMTETGRGCEVGCKFCVAGYMYRPVRKRSLEVLQKSVKVGVECGDSVGFVGAAVSSHQHISTLARSVAEQGKRASLSSIMTQKVSEELAASLSESEYKTVALAPEAGNEELRFRIGKRVCNEQIVEGVRKLARGGIRNFKLYFIVGLPSEQASDVEDIGRLVREAHEAAVAGAREQESFTIVPRIVLSVNPFIPKAWTPFQRHTFMDPGELKDRLETIRSAVRKIPNVEMKNESPRESYFQTVMSRGDRRVGDMLVEMLNQGEDWRWFVRMGDEQLAEDLPPGDFYVYRTIPQTEMLPWCAIDLRIKPELLTRQYERTFSEDVTPLIARAKLETAQLRLEEQAAQQAQI